MVGRRVGRAIVVLAVALGGVAGCGSEKRSKDGDPALSGSSGLAGGGASGSGGGSGGVAAGTSGVAGESSGGTIAGASGSTGGTGNVSGGAAGTSAGGVPGGSSAGGSAGSAAGTPVIDCSGVFTGPAVVFEPGITFSSPTLSADETELLYSVSDGIAAPVTFQRATRASKLDPFGPSEAIPELDSVCLATPDGTIDLSADGLRAYIVCYDSPGGGELRLAVRSARGAEFVVDAQSYGNVGASAAIATGDRTLYSSGLRLAQTPGLVFERARTSAPFGTGVAIPGLEDLPLTTPDPSADGLSLVFGVSGDVMVATRARADEPFGNREVILTPPSTSTMWVAPTISEDCRSLYVIRVVPGLGGLPYRTLEVFVR